MRCSVAMATYNAGSYLERQLETLSAQDRLPDELVVSDDASTDGTWEHLQDFARHAPFPVRPSRNAERVGATGNFERALAACTGDLLFLADQDDLWQPNKLSRMCALFAERPDLGAAFSDAEVVDQNERSLGYRLWEALGFDRGEQERVRAGRAAEVFARHVVAAGTTLAIRAEHRPLCLPFPDLHSAHDAWIAFLIACVAPIATFEDALIRYRVHGGNLVGIRRLGFRDQIAQARQQLAREASGYTLSFFEQARQRLEGAEAEVRPEVSGLLSDKIEHETARMKMSRSWLARVPLVLGEIGKGRYGRYAYGWKSAAQDLFLRPASTLAERP